MKNYHINALACAIGTCGIIASVVAINNGSRLGLPLLVVNLAVAVLNVFLYVQNVARDR